MRLREGEGLLLFLACIQRESGANTSSSSASKVYKHALFRSVGGGRVCEGGARCGGRARRNPWRLIDRSRKHANDKRARAFFVKTKT
ncbi:unnamed protein product [Macrosiphum euphorbiae]|uniref:Secreted protein n=1 Tax=Macrosiphum euphorbiae TaxID=13131 RepID=A0AAV0XGF7_9HEMI|nr:unnamed protein product [Macrosiphum euphorbiae]